MKRHPTHVWISESEITSVKNAIQSRWEVMIEADRDSDHHYHVHLLINPKDEGYELRMVDFLEGFVKGMRVNE